MQDLVCSPQRRNREMKKSTKNKKALLNISGGGDNSSRYTEGEVKSLVRESDVLIYAPGVFGSDNARWRTPEEAAGPAAGPVDKHNPINVCFSTG